MIRDNLLKALAGMLLFVLGMGALGLLFEDQLTLGTTWIVDRIGFIGMALILLVTDTLVTPFPPDLLLVLIAKSRLAENWPVYVFTLGVVSVCAGMLGWGIGRWLGHLEVVKRVIGEFREDHRAFIRKYGFWAVALGAVTPLPYSLTCWGAGVLGISGTSVLAASILFRIPRFVLYYWVLSSAGSLFSG